MPTYNFQKYWKVYDQTPLHTMWATCCTAFFSLLRVSEFTAPTQSHFNSSSHLSLTDVTLDSHTSLQVVRITLKQSKTDQLRLGTHLYLGKTGHHVCPVEAIIPYLIARGNRPAPPPLFYATKWQDAD